MPPPAPLDGITEIRVHGVGGTTPHSLLGDLAPQQVSGDRIAGFYRTSDVDRRHVEAYSWGGLTSHSGTRVLWLLLLPFALANLAGWMCAPGLRHSATFRWVARLGALATTVNVVVLLSMVSVDVVAYQCGGRSECTEGRWWSGPLGWDVVDGSPGRLIVLGALVPLAAVVLLAMLGRRTRTRYDDRVGPALESETPRAFGSAASLRGGLSHPDFWRGAYAGRRLSDLHVAGSVAVLALLVTHTSATAVVVADGRAALSPLRWSVTALASLVLLGVVALLARDPQLSKARPRDRLSTTALWSGVVALALAVVHAWLQPAVTTVDAPLPGMRVTVNWMYGGVLVALGLVLLVTARSAIVERTGRRSRDGAAVGARVPTFGWQAPVVALGLALLVLNAVLLGVVVRLADLLGDVSWDVGTVLPPGEVTLVLFPTIRQILPWLTLAPLVPLIAFALWQGWTLLRSQRADRLEAIHREHEDARRRRPPAPPPSSWWEPAMPELWQEVRRTRRRAEMAWLRKQARARRLAEMPLDVGRLLTWMIAAAIVVTIGYEIVIWRDRETLPPSLFVGLGTVVATLIPLALLGLLRRGFNDLSARRRLGVLWDVGTFWPRSFHPLAPPSYAERAVPDLQRRVWCLHDHEGQVLLATHSQGTVLAAAALLQKERLPAGLGMRLVTFGSPLMKLYGWGFPAYVNVETMAGVAANLPDGAAAWRNFVYPSDYIGGPVDPTGDPRLAGVDVPLVDPQTCWYVFGEEAPGPLRHSGYWADERVWDQVSRFTRELENARTGPVAASS